jgi:Family of unknown function (DUF6151)
MRHPLECKCGVIKGVVAGTSRANHGICYCRDCQAYAHFLGSTAAILDARGGSEIVQVLPSNVILTQGLGSLACMRLTPKGLLRWYASCCRTPIGNTLATPKVSFIGLLHSCLEAGNVPISDSFGPVVALANTASAIGSPKPKMQGLGRSLRWFVGTVLRARISGDYKRTPFFNAGTGEPVAVPQVLTEGDRARLLEMVQAASGG